MGRDVWREKGRDSKVYQRAASRFADRSSAGLPDPVSGSALRPRKSSTSEAGEQLHHTRRAASITLMAVRSRFGEWLAASSGFVLRHDRNLPRFDTVLAKINFATIT